MSEREALALVRRLLAEALGQQPSTSTTIRDLAGQNGALKATMRAALVVIDAAGGES
ncbi:hypothetical protein [Streptomyces gossypiisoli]|uniref:hypothetical protein n=1 Tax=Streptomyces gossypiisoli TaxID=2748864 RepID=UPI0015DB3569|nr:hypothetical protein [Streptomyces gossypiisoli]